MGTRGSPGPEQDVIESSFALEAGVVVGRVDGDVVRALGIPYAEAARFTPPVPVTRYAEPIHAFDRAPAAPQLPSKLFDQLIGAADLDTDENCQRLSITAPADLDDDELLPVYGKPARQFAARHRDAGGHAYLYRLTWRPNGNGYGAAHLTDLPCCSAPAKPGKAPDCSGRPTGPRWIAAVATSAASGRSSPEPARCRTLRRTTRSPCYPTDGAKADQEEVSVAAAETAMDLLRRRSSERGNAT